MRAERGRSQPIALSTDEDDNAGEDDDSAETSEQAPVHRTFFPETWLWRLERMRSVGQLLGHVGMLLGYNHAAIRCHCCCSRLERFVQTFGDMYDMLIIRVPGLPAKIYVTTGWPKKIGTIILYALTLPNINRFSKLLHYQNQEKICNNTITKDPATPQVCRYSALWNVKCLTSNNWKQDDLCNNTF